MDLPHGPPPQPTLNTPTTPAAPPPTGTTADDRSTAFRPVEGGGQMQSGEKLLVEAYAAIWIVLFLMILLSWRRQRRIDERVSSLEAAVEKARQAEGAKGGG
jgi:CcmD family protein